jgi:hypothetical protein
MSVQPFSVPPVQFERLQSKTGFTAILETLVKALPGGVGVALVDAEGEAVDYAGDRIDPFDVKVTAAQWRILLPKGARRGGSSSAPRNILTLSMRSRKATR